MMKCFRKIHLYAYFAAVLFFFILSYPLLYYYTRNPKAHYGKIVALRRWISLSGLYAVGIRIQVAYETPIDWSQNYVLCANHTSFLDITILNYLCKSPFSFMGKAELLKNPVTRIFFQTIDIPVKRNSNVSAFKAYKRALELLQESRSVAIFPEGGIDDSFPPTLHAFKSGAFRMAQETGTPILPVVIQDAWQILWDNGTAFGSKPGCIKVHVLTPIPMQKDRRETLHPLETEVYHKMKETWEGYNK